MKKFLTALLAASILIPSPILADDKMESMDTVSSEFEEMDDINEELEVISLDETSVMNESTSTDNTCTVNFKAPDKTTSVEVPIKNNVISRLDLIRYIPNGYHFTKEPKDIKYKSGVSTYTVEIAQTSSEQSKWAMPNYEAPCLLQYKDKASNSNPSYWLDFDAWNKVASNNEIPVSKLTAKLKEVDSNAPYTIENPVKRDQLGSVFYLSGSQLTVCGYRFASGAGAVKRVNTNLDTRNITIKLGNEICELQAGDFKENNNSSTSVVDANGDVKVTATTLQNALNAMAKRTNKNYKNGTFTVTGSSIEPATLNVYETNPIGITGATVKLSLSSQSYIGIHFTGANNTSFGMTYIKLGDIDKDNEPGKVSFNEMSTYLNSYSKDLVLAETNDNKKGLDFTNIDFTREATPIRNIDVIPAKDPDTLYNQTFTISFVDSETGKSVSSDDSREWSRFFRTDLGVELNQSNMIADLLPTGYGVALEQIPSSTAQTKKKLSSLSAQGNFSFSILGPKKVTLYVTKLEGYKENTGGHIATKPDTPTPVEPNVPQAPVQQPEPEQPAVTPTQGKQHMFRLYNKTTGEHLYTGSAAEKEKLLAENSGWSDEGQGWIAAAVSAYPVYRLFNPNSGEHHYTKDKNEYETLIRYGWKGEDKAFFSADDINNKITVYRLYNSTAPDIAKHHYTTSKEERDKLIGEGWANEGTGWYGMPLE